MRAAVRWLGNVTAPWYQPASDLIAGTKCGATMDDMVAGRGESRRGSVSGSKTMTMDQEANTQERQEAGAEADLIRTTERERLRALVLGNMEVAHQLHADDFQLIHPGGGSLSKEQYLGGLASGQLKYLVFEPDAIEVRV